MFSIYSAERRSLVLLKSVGVVDAKKADMILHHLDIGFSIQSPVKKTIKLIFFSHKIEAQTIIGLPMDNFEKKKSVQRR